LGTRERREREREELRTKILDAARELFANEGYEAVTLRKIAARIEYSPTAIYLHFKDKEAVLREICDADFGALAEVFAAIARIADPRQRLVATGNAYAEFGLSHPNHYRLMFMTPHPPFTEESRLEHGNPEQDAYAFLRGILAEAQDAGRLRPGLGDLELLTQTTWAALHGVISLEIAKCNDDWVDWRPAAERVRLMIDFIAQALWADDDGAAAGKRTTGKRAVDERTAGKRTAGGRRQAGARQPASGRED
jgi:AcrR family transcriptional regulator